MRFDFELNRPIEVKCNAIIAIDDEEKVCGNLLENGTKISGEAPLYFSDHAITVRLWSVKCGCGKYFHYNSCMDHIFNYENRVLIHHSVLNEALLGYSE